MLRFDAVLFDNGHTLFYRPSAVDSIVSLAMRCGVAVSESEAVQAWETVKANKQRGPEHRRERNSSRDAHHDYYVRQYGPLEEIAPGLAELFYVEHKTSPRLMSPYPDTPLVLRALRRAGVAVGIVSNTGWDISQGYMLAGVDDLIDTWVLSWQHGTAKPDPRLFTHACEELGVAPSRVLMVGNDAEADGGAAAIGATVLILPEVGSGEERGLGRVLDLLDIPGARDRQAEPVPSSVL